MLESDARTKWCPFARVAAPITETASRMTWVVANRVSIPEDIGTLDSNDPMNPPAARCIASDCMAWREMDEELGGVCGLAR